MLAAFFAEILVDASLEGTICESELVVNVVEAKSFDSILESTLAAFFSEFGWSGFTGLIDGSFFATFFFSSVFSFFSSVFFEATPDDASLLRVA